MHTCTQMSHVQKVSVWVPRYARTAGSTLGSSWWAWVSPQSPFCLPKEASADRRSGHPLGIPQCIFLLNAFGTQMHLALNQEPLSSLLLAWIIELTANWFGYWKDTNIVAQVTKQTKNSKFNWWLIRNIFHILGLLHVFVTISKCICSITHSTTTACLLVLCWWVTLICAFPLRSRSTADHCTVCSFQSKPREALAVSLLSLRSFCRVYCWVSS